MLGLSGTSQSLAGFNKTHLIKYIKDTIIPYTQNQPSLLIIDCATYHRDNENKQLCSNNHIELLYIPDRCTDSCQPLDVGIFGPVKMQCNAEFKKHAAGVVESHRKLSIKYEAFVRAWNHLRSKQLLVHDTSPDYDSSADKLSNDI